jgi:hypothetical protein
VERDNGTSIDVSDEMDRQQVQDEQPIVFGGSINMAMI